jgi:hypothetical protein
LAVIRLSAKWSRIRFQIFINVTSRIDAEDAYELEGANDSDLPMLHVGDPE